jgi:hypothetical protein
MKRALAMAALAGLLIAAGPPPARIVLDIKLTPRAAAKLAQLGESITVSAMYEGKPTARHKRKADNMGQIDLGQDRITVPGKSQRAVVPTKGLKLARLSWIKGSKPRLLINVYTARRKHPDNLLNCGIYEGPLSAVAGKPIPIACDLI